MATAQTIATRDRNAQPRGYSIVIQDRDKTWGGWQPDTLDDSPPCVDRDKFDILPRVGSVAELYRELLERNAQFLPHGATRWAMLMEIGRDEGIITHCRCLTPFTFYTPSIRAIHDWQPRHLLDVPPFAWDVNGCQGDRHRTLEAAIEEAACSNTYNAECLAERDEIFWRAVVAVEWEPIMDDTHSVSDFGAGLSGIRVSQTTERFHIVTRDAWRMPEGLDLELPTSQLVGHVGLQAEGGEA